MSTLPHLLKAQQIRPTAETAFMLGFASNTLQKPAEALQWLCRSLALDIQDPFSAFFLGEKLPQQFSTLRAESLESLYNGIVTISARLGTHDDETLRLLKSGLSLAHEDVLRGRLQDKIALYCAAQGKYADVHQLLGQSIRFGMLVADANQKGAIQVRGIDKGMPADLAGILPGDILTSLDGKSLAEISSNELIKSVIPKLSFGTRVPITVLRSGKQLNKEIVAGVPPNLAEVAASAGAIPSAPSGPQIQTVAPPRPESTPAPERPSIQIRRLEVKPNVVSPKGPFDLEIEYSVSDPAAAQQQLPVEFALSIDQGANTLYTQPASKAEVPNGAARMRVEHLTASPQPGAYRIKIKLSYKGLITEDSAEFQIR